MATLKNTIVNDTGFLQLPIGTTAQRPSSPSAGTTRFNTSINAVEYYNGSTWISNSAGEVSASGGSFTTDIVDDGISYRVHTFNATGNFVVTQPGEVEYLIVAGGGGGGGDNAGGGGGGGVLIGKTFVTPQTYTVSVGLGGTGGAINFRGAPGGNSSVFGLTAFGGGGGGGGDNGGAQTGATFANAQLQAGSGGSGGGGGSEGGNGTGGAGTAGQGFAGGDGFGGSGGGGGGAGGVGTTAISSTSPGNGGHGIASSISGYNRSYGGGGAGAPENSAVNVARSALGGSGGGGAGFTGNELTIFRNGAANTGGGGAGVGCFGSCNFLGGAGGSGIVIVRYKKKQLRLSMPTSNGLGLLFNFDAADSRSYWYGGAPKSWKSTAAIPHTGTLNSNNISFKGTWGGVLSFPGAAADYVQMTSTNFGNLGQYTISYWARRDAESRMVIGGSDTSFYWFGDNSWRYTHSGGAGEFYYPKNVSIPLGTWGYYVATYDGANVRIYRQGVLEGSQATTGTANFDGRTFRFSYYNNTSTYSFIGDIATITMYNRALGQDEITQNFEADRRRFGI